MAAKLGAPEILSLDRLFIFSCPRTASNLFMRVLSVSDQPMVLPEENADTLHFLSALTHMREVGLTQKPCRDWAESEKEDLKGKFQNAFDRLHDHMIKARAAGKATIVKEHSAFVTEPSARDKLIYGDGGGEGESLWKVQLPEEYDSLPSNLAPNETIFPSEFLLTCFPTFLIRHPMLVFPSYYRTFLCVKKKDTQKIHELQNQLRWTMTFKWTRALYDWYTDVWTKYGSALNRPKSIILEADDVLTTDVIVRYCDLVQLDSSKLKFTWEPTSASEMASRDRKTTRMKDTLLTSSGILQDKTSQNLTLENEVAKWKVEFGETEGSQLEEWVKGAMPDYEYLWNNRLR